MIPFSCFSEFVNKATTYFNQLCSIMEESDRLVKEWSDRLPGLINECRAFVKQKDAIVSKTQPPKPLLTEDLRKMQEELLRTGVDEDERMRMFEEKKADAIQQGVGF